MSKNPNPSLKPLRRVEVDAYAILAERATSLAAQVSEMKERIRASLSPGEIMDGYAYSIGMSEAPEVSGKVDYRAELIKAIGKRKVEALESDAAKVKTPGTPRVLPPRPNPNASVDAIQAAVALRKKIERRLDNGASMADVIAGLEIGIDSV